MGNARNVIQPPVPRPVNVPIWRDVFRDVQHVIPALTQNYVTGDWLHNTLDGCASDGVTVASGAAALDITRVRMQTFNTQSGMFRLSTLSGWNYILRSPDGFTAWTEVFAQDNGIRGHGGYPAAIIDCGPGKVMFAEYADQPKLWYSADSGTNWTELFQAVGTSIRHYHGGRFDATHGNLYLFTGDTDAASSILMCDDLDDLIANPTVWRDRWGLSDDARSTINDNYILGRGDQTWRVLDAALFGDWIYFGRDGSGGAGHMMSRCHRVTRERQRVWVEPSVDYTGPAGDFVGSAWGFWVTSNDLLLMFTNSERLTDNSGYRATHDQYLRLYSTLPDDPRRMAEIARVLRTDHESPSNATAQWGNLLEWQGHVVATSKSLVSGIIGQVSRSPEEDRQKQAELGTVPASPGPVNFCKNGRFISDVTGWDTGAVGISVAHDATVFDRGHFSSMKVTSTVASYVFQAPASALLAQVLGHVMTLTMRIMTPTTFASGKQIAAQLWVIADHYSGSSITTQVLPAANWDGEWYTLTVTMFVPRDATLFRITIQASGTVESPTVAHVSDARLNIGLLPLPGNSLDAEAWSPVA